MSCENCQLKDKVSALEKDAERNSKQHEVFYEKFNKIAVDLGVNDNTLSTLVITINELRTDVRSLKDEPSKNYSAIKMCIITAVISAIASGLVGFLLSMLLVK